MKGWKKKLTEVLKEHPDIDKKLTGQVEIHCNEGGVTKVYEVTSKKERGSKVIVYKEIK